MELFVVCKMFARMIDDKLIYLIAEENKYQAMNNFKSARKSWMDFVLAQREEWSVWVGMQCFEGYVVICSVMKDI